MKLYVQTFHWHTGRNWAGSHFLQLTELFRPISISPANIVITDFQAKSLIFKSLSIRKTNRPSSSHLESPPSTADNPPGAARPDPVPVPVQVPGPHPGPSPHPFLTPNNQNLKPQPTSPNLKRPTTYFIFLSN